jgi:hypothetical protein
VLVKIKSVEELKKIGYILTNNEKSIHKPIADKGFYTKECGKIREVEYYANEKFSYHVLNIKDISYQTHRFSEDQVKVIDTKLAKILFND